MSILENLKPKTNQTHAPIGPGIQHKLNEAQGRLKPLEASQSAIALDAELGVPGAQAKLTALMQDIAAEKATMARLRLALTAGLERDQAAIAAQRASLRKAQVAALRKHLDSRDAAAVEMCAAIAEAVKHWKVVVERSKKAGDIVPIGDTLPVGAISELGELRRLVAQEIYRHDGGDVLVGSARSFPGAATDLDHQGTPNTIEPFTDHLRRNSAFVMQAITGKAPE